MSKLFSLVWPALLLRRDPYLRMELSTDGPADGLIIVGTVGIIEAVALSVSGSFDLVAFLLTVVFSVFGWLILAGITYLVGKHLFQGSGRFDQMIATTSLAHPARLVSSALLLLNFDPGLALVLGLPWFIACLAVATRVTMEMENDRAVPTAILGFIVWFVVRLIFRF